MFCNKFQFTPSSEVFNFRGGIKRDFYRRLAWNKRVKRDCGSGSGWQGNSRWVRCLICLTCVLEFTTRHLMNYSHLVILNFSLTCCLEPTTGCGGVFIYSTHCEARVLSYAVPCRLTSVSIYNHWTPTTTTDTSHDHPVLRCLEQWYSADNTIQYLNPGL